MSCIRQVKASPNRLGDREFPGIPVGQSILGRHCQPINLSIHRYLFIVAYIIWTVPIILM